MEGTDGILLTLLGLVSVNLIVPFTQVLKANYIPANWAFLTWGIQAILSVLLAWIISLVLMPMSGEMIVFYALTIMGGNGAAHANQKMRIKINGGGR